jgi:hypothetical protein
VRCAHCKTTWFAAGPKGVRGVNAFVDDTTAEAESLPPMSDDTAAATRPEAMQAVNDDFCAEASNSITAIETETPPV